MPEPQIIAMGGGGFTTEPGKPTFFPYVLQACGKEQPAMLFLGTATGDAEKHILNFYVNVNRIGGRPDHISLWGQPPDMQARVEAADIICVGGGNTRNMIALWHAAGLDELLRRAWERGTVLCGQSAGAICWFQNAQTKSSGEFGRVECLGFLEGGCAAHYDNVPERRPHLHEMIMAGMISPGYGISNDTALHFKGTGLHAVLASQEESYAYRIDRVDGEIVEERLEARLLTKRYS